MYAWIPLCKSSVQIAISKALSYWQIIVLVLHQVFLWAEGAGNTLEWVRPFTATYSNDRVLKQCDECIARHSRSILSLCQSSIDIGQSNAVVVSIFSLLHDQLFFWWSSYFPLLLCIALVYSHMAKCTVHTNQKQLSTFQDYVKEFPGHGVLHKTFYASMKPLTSRNSVVVELSF